MYNMKLRKLGPVLFVALLCVQRTLAVINFMSDEHYARMPPLFHMDDLEACKTSKGLYCSVDIGLVSDEPNELLTMIQEFSERRTHFNHSHLFYGLCVTETCKDYIDRIDVDLTKPLERCLNESMFKNYGLKTNIFTTPYCMAGDKKLDKADIGVIILCIVLVLCNVVGSFYGIYCKDVKHGSKFLLAFSIPHNWRTFWKPVSNKYENSNALKSLLGLRTFLTLIVVGGHSLLIFFTGISNTHDYEKTYDSKSYYLTYNGSTIIHTFFLISGCLLMYQLLLSTEKRKMTAMDIYKGLVRRWWRFTPSLAVILAVVTTLQRFIADGPLWQKVVITEVNDCRKDWWLILSYIHNYTNTECMAQNWYLAANMQLYGVGLVFFCLLRSNRARKVGLSFLMLLGIIIPMAHVWFQDLDPFLMVTPEACRKMFALVPTFVHLHKRAHTNLVSFVVGLGLGYCIHKAQKTPDFNIQKYKKYRVVYWSLLPLALAVMTVGGFFYKEGPRPSVYWRMLYAGFGKTVFSLCCATILFGAVFKFENTYRSILEWRGWDVPGKLCYSAIMLHITMLRIIGGYMPIIMVYGNFLLVGGATALVILTFLISFPFWLLVEHPLEQIAKILTSETRKKPEIMENNSTEKKMNLNYKGEVNAQKKDN